MEQFSATEVVLLLNKVGNKVFLHRESGYKPYFFQQNNLSSNEWRSYFLNLITFIYLNYLMTLGFAPAMTYTVFQSHRVIANCEAVKQSR